jgi:hypothetical protein
MNRRDVLRGLSTAPVVGAVALSGDYAFAEKPAEVAQRWLCHRLVELPLHPGDEIAAMTQFRDSLVVVSKRGDAFYITPEEIV